MVFYSNGASVMAGMAIYDMMQGCGCEVHTYCIGRAASMTDIQRRHTLMKSWISPETESFVHPHSRITLKSHGQKLRKRSVPILIISFL